MKARSYTESQRHDAARPTQLGDLSLTAAERPEARQVVLQSLIGLRSDAEKVRRALGSPRDADALQYGFEAEYGLHEADRLLLLYTPTAEAGFDEATFRGMKPEERAAWVRQQLPKQMFGPYTLPLVRATQNPDLDFLPERLIVDTTYNVEIVGTPQASLEAVLKQIRVLGEVAGVGSLQGTLSAPSQLMFERQPERSVDALFGFFNFHHLVDAFAKLDNGYAKYRARPESPPVQSFTHPFLGPITRAKQFFMRRFIEGNAKGEKLDPVSLQLVRRTDSSFKYVGGSAYRPDIAPLRVSVEIRDCHKNEALLRERFCRNTWRFTAGLDAFVPFAKVQAFDPNAHYEALPASVRAVLPDIIPTAEKPELADAYEKFDRLALQVYRNFGFPMKDYTDVLTALECPTLARQVEEARRDYVTQLEEVADAFAQGAIDKKGAAIAMQGALARFGVASGLAERLRHWENRKLVDDPLAGQALQMTIDGLTPLSQAFPQDIWLGSLAERVAELTSRWPNNVRYTSTDSLDISLRGLSDEERRTLSNDYVRAASHDTVGLQEGSDATAHARLGDYTITVDHEGMDATKFVLQLGYQEALVELSTVEQLRLRKEIQTAARNRRIEASPRTWLYGLRVGAGGATLSQMLTTSHARIAVRVSE